MIALLASLGALLLAAAGMARHIWRHRGTQGEEVPLGTMDLLPAAKRTDSESEY